MARVVAEQVPRQMIKGLDGRNVVVAIALALFVFFHQLEQTRNRCQRFARVETLTGVFKGDVSARKFCLFTWHQHRHNMFDEVLGVGLVVVVLDVVKERA